jgi:predicted GIY-YIG superfamily endonuclease
VTVATRVVHFLVTEAGVRQFLDTGTRAALGEHPPGRPAGSAGVARGAHLTARHQTRGRPSARIPPPGASDRDRMSLPLVTLCLVDQYLYRLFGPDGTLLYTGVSDDWTRRLRQHWQTKQWAPEILGVTLEAYSDRRAVLAAERKAIRAENPLYNIQHNHHGPVPEEPGTPVTAADVLLIGALIIAVGFIVYEISQVAIEKYQGWKADRQEFRQWRDTRNGKENQASPGCDTPDAGIVSPTAVIPPTASSPDPLNRAAFISIMALYANQPRLANDSPSSAPPRQDGSLPT